MFSANHTCWMYEPRAMKPLLSFISAHSKLVKRELVNCLKNILDRSCFHTTDTGFQNKVAQLKAAGYPDSLLVSVAESIKKKRESSRRGETTDADTRHTRKCEKVAVISHMCQLSHRMKKVGECMALPTCQDDVLWQQGQTRLQS